MTRPVAPRTDLDWGAIRTDLVLRWKHGPRCGEGAEFPWDCTCDFQGSIERMEAVIARAEAAALPSPEPSTTEVYDFPDDYTEPEARAFIAGFDAGRITERRAAPATPEPARSGEEEPYRVEPGHNHTTAGLPTYPVFRAACPLGCDKPLPPTEQIEVTPGRFSPRPRMLVVDPIAEGEAGLALKRANERQRSKRRTRP
jgi:hypothetical protein